MSRKRVPLNQNECTADFGIGVPFEQNLQDKLVLLGFFTVEPKFYKEKKHVLEWKEQAKMCMRFQKDIRQSLNLVLC